MFIFKGSKVVLLIVVLIFLSSCRSRKKVIYFQGDGDISVAETNKNYNPVFHTDDFISIVVLGLDVDGALPFNLPVPSFNTSNIGYVTGSPSQYGYLIDSNGEIDFPVIGKIKLAGINRMEATEMLKEKLKAYINSPLVIMRIQNYKVTVIGDVRTPGTFSIPNERITILEALGLAGDLNLTAVRKNVLVIRDVDGKKTETRIDLTAKDIFASPVYYLHQNDVVYVEPNRARVNSSAVNAPNAGIAISVISLIVTAIALIVRR